MKQRFSSLDIRVIAHELSKTCVSLRVSNIYDLSTRIFLLKLAKPDHREQLLIDSGFRCHLTSFARTTAGTPSVFVSRLRKFLKTRRITSVSQVGTDRILEFQFSDGQYRLFLEFYAGGNIVLTDRELTVIALLRTVTEGAEHEHLQLGVKYSLTERQNYDGLPLINLDTVKKGIQNYGDRLADQDGVKKPGKSRKKAGDHLTKALSSAVNQFPPPLIEHVLRAAGIDVATPPNVALNDEPLLQKILAALENADTVINSITQTDAVAGYIIAKPQTVHENHDKSTAELRDASVKDKVLYFDFYPFIPAQFENDPTSRVLKFEGFNKTVDEFYSSLEDQRLNSRYEERQAAAEKKLDQAKKQQEDRISGLQAVQDLNVRKAEAIEANIARLEEAVAAINGLIGQGMDWVEIDRVIDLEQKRGNPVASIIKLPLKLKENTATFLLGEWEDDIDEAYETGSEPSDSDDDDDHRVQTKVQNSSSKTKEIPKDNRLAVEIDLGESMWSNARDYYDQRKSAASKQEKTKGSQEVALRNAKKKIDQDLQKSLKQEKGSLRAVRKQAWFEKFIYFISSDGYLVLGGRDASQSELIYRRYFKKGDVYVHADLKGAVPMIIKNRPGASDQPIPPTTLGQAGNLSVCTSTAWDSKAVMSAWWAESEQVSKTANTGDYLPPGEVFVKGQKQYLPPAQLILGFAIIFRISETSKSNHSKHRVTNSSEGLLAQQTEEGSTSKRATDEHSDGSDHDYDENEDNASLHDHEEDNNEKSENIDDSASEKDEEETTYENPLQSTAYEPGLASASADRSQADRLVVAKEDNTPGNDRDENEEASDSSDDSQDDDAETKAAEDAVGNGSAKDQRQKAKAQVRGKRGKRAKLKTKYKDQDEEDREAALRVLGSRIGQERAEAEAEAKLAAQNKAEEDKERRRQQHQRAQEEGRKRDEARLRKEAEAKDAADDDDDADEDQTNTVDLETLVGTPLHGDEVLEAIAVCAPWSALAKYKYKVKLQPGSTKKGKAIKEILGRWKTAATRKGVIDEKSQDTERMWPREVELLKTFNEVEIINVLPVGKVRILMSGATAAGGGGKGGGGGRGKGGGRGGKGSKKSR